ncbi:MAG TPA: PucR family transcriptional regulator ligand-binding domain-containing protein [Actinomycetes bacterium]|nr:PucR family transcriptional regulator ligand-binding domain-containing protein [Actinomycetes bacterium]
MTAVASGRTQASDAALPRVRDLLALPALTVGLPTVVAGASGLDARVRWVHVSELADIAGLLSGGEVILTTGIALPETDAELREYADALSAAGAVALIVELGRRFEQLPTALVRACETLGLPLVALGRELRFVKVTEAVHSLIVEEQISALHASEAAHRVFTRLCVEGAPAASIVHEAARLSHCPAVFENLMHQVLAHDAGDRATDDVLRDWSTRSRAAVTTAHSDVCGPEGWVVAMVEARGEVWGRLVLLPAGEPSALQLMVLERAATALTLNRLLEQQQDPMELQAHRTTLADIIDRRFESADDIHARTAALGVPTARRELVAVVVELSADRAHQPHARPRDLEAELVASALRAADVKGLVGSLRPGRVGVLVPLPDTADAETVLTRIAQHVLAKADSSHVSRPVIGVGSPVRDLDAVRRSFAEAAHAAEAAQGSTEQKPYYELPDVQLRGLLYVLGGDPRLQAFVERTLGPLLDHDARNDTDLVAVLGVYLANGRNKSAAAEAAHLSRQAFYQRLTTIEKVLGVDLDSAEATTSLHAAVMAYEALRPK